MRPLINTILVATLFALAAAEPAGNRLDIKPIVPDLLSVQIYESNGVQLQQSESQGLQGKSPLEIAQQFAREKLAASDFIVKDSYKTDINGVTHVYLRQLVNGLEVVNGDINVNVDANGNIISYGSSFFRGRTSKIGTDSAPAKTLTPVEALKALARHIKVVEPQSDKIQVETINNIQGEPETVLKNVPFAVPGSQVPVRSALIQTDKGRKLEPVWILTVEMNENWIQSSVHANTGKVLSLVDWVADATYNVFPLGTNDPNEGPRKLVVDPHDKIASPNGWHVQGTTNYTVTIGNNAYAQANLNGDSNWRDKPRPDGGKNLVFDFPLDLTKHPREYINASVTNLFYWNNIIHDLFYRYGFNEASGNFQEDNGNKGGKGGDAVIANAQDGSGTNNANFATPPDGQRGRMRMYIWTSSNPPKDGDLESGIIIHEYAHGISNRLTGGPSNVNCLPGGEAGGMGEGWGDFFATILRLKPNHNRNSEFGMGNYSAGRGIRKYPYSTSTTTNPETYGTMNNSGYSGVHAKGAVWANMLYEVFWNIVDARGFTPQWYPPQTTDQNEIKKYILSHGNTLMLQIVVDGMKLQPCRPNFITARDAILRAEKLLTNGTYECHIWRGFAKRGLGVDAKLIEDSPNGPGRRQESKKVPPQCERA
ncbi:uncharacterized protein VTP21DRAFT_8169 [Calcarisporiella thermophila]|uniref:uncharacterized protein n=1 Tax=Calcarisporiella thermophila TaxID=911321 RepID=UPI0037437386